MSSITTSFITKKEQGDKSMASRILIADDHEIVVEGIRTLLNRARREWEVCGEARNGREAVEMVRTLKPDIAVLDVTMPVMSGLEAAAEIAKLRSGCKVLIFTMHESERLVVEVRNAGAQGYVLKSQAARDLVRAIGALLEGDTFYGSSPEPAKQQKQKEDTGSGNIFCQALAFA
jgi:DNA-binding NarL/FixJ family response regulator